MIGVWFSCQQFCWLRLSGKINLEFSERPKTILFASSAETTMHGEIIAENAFLLICADIADYFNPFLTARKSLEIIPSLRNDTVAKSINSENGYMSSIC